MIFILGTGHCGSTLLDLILGSHSKIFSLGELKDLSVSYLSNKSNFWNSDLIKKIKPHYRFKNNKVISFDYHRFPSSTLFENRSHLYQYIFKRSQKDILVDSSKNIFWIKRSIAHLQNSDFEPILIHLERDPRAIVNSYYRKYKTSKDFSQLVNDIRNRINKNRAYFKSQEKCEKITVSYEEICMYPEKEITKICNLIGVEFYKEILNYWEFEHNNISGNSGTNSLINKYRNEKSLLHHKRNDQEFYENHPLSIRLDERWKQELSSDQIENINQIFNLK